MFNVYAIESLANRRIYIGHTADIGQRLKYHNSGYVNSTAQDRPWSLVAIEKVASKNKARWLERSLKESRGKRIKWLVKNRLQK
jgi:predicted GIY-YIG superfamily endonuclease